MRPFTYDALPGRVIFGAGASDRVGDEVERLGGGRVLLITAGSSAPVGDRIAAQLGGRLVGRFDRVAQHVPEGLAAEAREAAAETGADTLLTVGGGSAIGLAKAIAVETGIAILAVPTTYSGSEMTPFYGITGEHKQTGRDPKALPRAVVYDPTLTTALPPSVTGPSGMNALAHCVEALYAPGTNPVVGLMAEEGVRALGRALPAAVRRPDDLEARSDALYGAYLAGAALAVAGIALHHKLCHVLGGTYGLVHGNVHSVVLPYAVAYNAPAVRGEMARVAAALGGPADAGAAAGLLYDLAVSIGVPTSLRAIGMPEDGLRPAAERTADSVGTENPRPVDATSLERLLAAAYEGRRP